MKTIHDAGTGPLLEYNTTQMYFSNSSENAYTLNPGKFIYRRKKNRLLVKKGTENILLRLEDIVLMHIHNKVVHVIDQSSKKYIYDKFLNELIEELDNTIFFRVNRQYIVNINYIQSFRSYQNVKLSINITSHEIKHTIILRQGNGSLI